MTIENLTVIGNSWGKPAGMEGPEHFWFHGVGKNRITWRSACGAETLDKMDEFGGTPIIHLTMERNPLKQKRCLLCSAARGD